MVHKYLMELQLVAPLMILLITQLIPGTGASYFSDLYNSDSNNLPKIVENDKTNQAIWTMDLALKLKDRVTPELREFREAGAKLMIQELALISKYFEAGRPDVKRENATICTGCEVFAGVVFLQTRFYNSSLDTILDQFKYLCPTFSFVTTPQVCIGLLDRLLPTMYYIIQNRPNLKVEAFCGFTFQQLGCNTDDPYLEWSLELPPPPPPEKPFAYNQKKIGKRRRAVSAPNSKKYDQQSLDRELKRVRNRNRNRNRNRIRNQNQNQANNNNNLIKIIHLTDIHIDPKYRFKSQAVCDNHVLCCHRDSTIGLRNVSDLRKAGFFGDNHKCDIPQSLLKRTLRHLRKEHSDAKLIYMTGDLVSHNLWATTKTDNIEVIRRTSKLIQRHFPHAKIQFFPMLGNHETHPVNQFSPPGVPKNLNTRWIYDVLYAHWNQWIPFDQVRNFFTEGYYAVDVSSSLKIVALNTNVCYGFNFWGMFDVKDPGGQLAWLISELSKSETVGQSVHILGHIPPGHPDCNKVFSRNFYRIITRFQKTVKAQFYGHTHFDELKLYYDPNNVEMNPISPLFISPSLTSNALNNPSYKIFYAHPVKWDILDFETWVFDLEEANQTPDKEPRWFPLYRATTAYEIPDTSLANLGRFVHGMAGNKTLFDLFHQHYYKALPRQRRLSTVNRQKNLLCDIVTAYSTADTGQCHKIIQTVNSE